jgi:hypothetical protein
MRKRSYEFYELRRGWDDSDVIYRRDTYEECVEYYNFGVSHPDNGDGVNYYIVRNTLVTAFKADKK